MITDSEACNHTKQAPGWRLRPVAGDPQEILLTTPTGHRYLSRAPSPPGEPGGMPPSRIEYAFRDLLLQVA